MATVESLTTTQIRAEIAAAAGPPMFDAAVRASSAGVEYSRSVGLGYSKLWFNDWTFSDIEGWPSLPVEYGNEGTRSFSPSEDEGGLFVARHMAYLQYTGATPPGDFAEMLVNTYYDTWSHIHRVPHGPSMFANPDISFAGEIMTPPFFSPGITTEDDSGYIWFNVYFASETETIELPPSKGIIELYRIRKQDAPT